MFKLLVVIYRFCCKLSYFSSARSININPKRKIKESLCKETNVVRFTSDRTYPVKSLGIRHSNLYLLTIQSLCVEYRGDLGT